MVGVIIDAAVIGILVIVLIVGLVRGFLNSSFGLINFICFIVASIFLMPLAVNALAKLSPFESLGNTFANWINKAGAYMTAEITAADDAASVLQSAGIPSFLAGIGASVCKAGLNAGAASVTLGGMLGLYAMKALVGILAVIVFAVAIKLILLGVRKLLRKLHKIKFFKILDRLTGMLFCLALTSAIFLFALGELYTVRERVKVVDNALAGTKVVKLVYEKNPFQKLIDENVNLERFIQNTFKK